MNDSIDIINWKLGNTFGDNLTDIMADKSKAKDRMTVAKLEELSGVNASTISSYKTCSSSKKGNKNQYKSPSLENAAKIAMALGVSIEKLCGLPEDLSTIDKNEDKPICETIKLMAKIIDLGVLHFSFEYEEGYTSLVSLNYDCHDYHNDQTSTVFRFITEYLRLSEVIKEYDNNEVYLQACIDKHINRAIEEFYPNGEVPF